MSENTSNNPIQEEMTPDAKIEFLAMAIMELTGRVEELEKGESEGEEKDLSEGNNQPVPGQM
jgi:hypothetical protein